MRLESRDLIQEYYNTIKETYPDLTPEDCKEICSAPWKFLKQEIESGELPEIRFKYFGTFQVYKGRAENMLFNLKERFKLHKIDRHQYFRLKEMLEKYLKRLENESQETED